MLMLSDLGQDAVEASEVAEAERDRADHRDADEGCGGEDGWTGHRQRP
jgi:hypothetical protein